MNEAALAGSIFLLSIQAAAADGLFRQPSSAERQAATAAVSEAEPLPPDLEVTRTAIVVADPYYVRSHLAPEGAQNLTEDQRNIAASRLTSEIKMTLFPDITLNLRRTGISAFPKDPNTYLWSGHAEPPRAGDVSITVADGIFGGEIVLYDSNKTYLISHLDGNLYRVLETITPNTLPDIEELDNGGLKAPNKLGYNAGLGRQPRQ